jgi:uncharacterized damage-inducible protein DinB
MNLEDVRNLVNFHYWARNRMFDAVSLLSPEQYIKEVGGSFGSVRNTVVHTFSAEYVWFSRWIGEPVSGLFSAERYPDFESVRAGWMDLEKNLRAYVARLDEQGLQKVLHYKSLAGVESASPIWQMVQHVVNHASYHRGQITTMLRQLGASPPKSTDLIAYYRENS